MEQNIETIQPKRGKKKIGCWIAGCLTALVVVILFVIGIISVAFWATKGPVKVVKEQLIYLKKGDLESAYELTSGDFRKATDLAQFRRFISTNHSLAQNKDASFTSRKIENNKGYVEGTLTAIDGSRTPVKYELIKENDEWKILYIELSPTGIKPIPEKEPVLTEVSVIESAIEKVEVGTQRAANGSILDASNSFPHGVGEIKVAAYVSSAKKGQRVSAVWYFAMEQITEPVVNIIMENGDYISLFSLTPPYNGWPTGDYKVVISIDEGKVTKEASYSIGL